jgi:3-isopropylmalate/(R)-2-methylmalate dehydratase small subunit
MTREPFITLESVAAPLMIDNIDTDQIIPSREMKSVSRSGLADGLFAGWRYEKPGERKPAAAFVLNWPDFEKAQILLAGSNFGCGSSREHAVWALAEYGVRCVIAPSFGEIFFGNCARNGVLAIVLDQETVQHLAKSASKNPQTHQLAIDLQAQTVTMSNEAFDFAIDPYHKKLLVEGLDPIALTLSKSAKIEAYLTDDAKRRPWIYATR